MALTLGCSASPSPARGNGGSGNASGGMGTNSLGGAPANGGTSTSSGSGGAPANGGSPGNGGTTTQSNGGASGGTTSSANGGTSTSSGSGGGGAPASGGMTGAAGACQMAKYNFEPKIPTVYVMVDRSGSMFDCLSTTNPEPSCKTPEDTSWVKLKTAALTVIDSLQGQVRFGFASFTGTNPASGGKCPMIDQVDPALNNQPKIKTLYDSLPFQPETTEQGKKFETPARESLDLIGEKLLADTSPGDKYILFVTDGQPDYCDDANTLCAPDSVVAGLQILKTKGITTIVMGLQSALPDLAPGILQSFANAGAGQPTLAPLKPNTDAFAFYDQCNGVAGWHADLVKSGKTAERGVTLGEYVTTGGGTAKLYAPSVADQAMIATQLGTALAGVKSCSFDLSNVNGQSIKVDLNTLSSASVSIEGKSVPQNATTGWSMASASQLVLNGASCDTWRSPENNKIDFNFPCNTIIFE